MVTIGTGSVVDTPSDTTFSSSATTGGAGVELKLVVNLSPSDVEKLSSDGSSIELYLEDDFSVPSSINRNDVYFIVASRMPSDARNDGRNDGRVRSQYGVVINDGDYFGGDDDWAIQVFIPDLQETSQETVADKSQTVGSGFQGAVPGDTITMVITTSAGIKNPSEAGMHSVGYRVLGVADDPDEGTADTIQDVVTNLTDLEADPVVENVVETVAKIALSADDGGRGKEVNIAGSGFNNGTQAEAYVLPNAIATWWDDLDCPEMNDAVSPEDDEPAVGADTAGTTYCKMYADLSDEAKPVVKRAGLASEALCLLIMDEGDSLGTTNVGTDDKFSIPFTVHQDEFKPGNVNYICAEDSEAGNPRPASAVKVFELTASISLDPAEANSGDDVTLKAKDFGGALDSISLGPDKTWTLDGSDTNAFPINTIEGEDYTFEVPGGLSGTIQVAAKRGTTRKTANLTVTPSRLTLSLDRSRAQPVHRDLGQRLQRKVLHARCREHHHRWSNRWSLTSPALRT